MLDTPVPPDALQVLLIRLAPRDGYVRWERDEPMALWQLDIVGGAFLADGTEAKIVTGVDDHSRYCMICQVVLRATGRAVCLAFAPALRRFGVPAAWVGSSGRMAGSSWRLTPAPARAR
jgi:hypothetical protein